jgi:hypothetical protein
MSSPQGVSFPLVDGARASTSTATGIIADAVRAVDPELAERVAASKAWRTEYIEHFGRLTALSADPQAAVAIAAAGLESMRRRIQLSQDGVEVALADAAPTGRAVRDEVTVAGSAALVEHLAIPYHGRSLAGAELREQLRRWLETGVVEAGFVSAIEFAIDHPEILRIPGRRVALVGAAAEMGPLEPLVAWGADVLALDVPVPAVWSRIEATAAAGAGTVTAPVFDDVPGIDTTREPGAVAQWLLSHAAPKNGLVFGMHAYADGGQHVLVSAATDAIAQWLIDARADTALAWLGTPTDSYLVPASVMSESRDRWSSRPAALRVVQAVTRTAARGALLRPAYATANDGTDWGVADIMLPMQGPNYALAKRLQRWRSVVAANSGTTASFNVAPASWTRSVTKNRVFNVAYSGASRFKVEIFPADTARWLMAAKLAADLAMPAPTPGGAHPEALMYADANHGGFWRAAYDPKSVLGLAAVAGLPATALKAARARVPGKG